MKQAWYRESLVYQIYPRSFQDSNGDGIGDLPGILSRIPYLQELGVDVVWLSPVYASPNDDNGYDISDYRDIHPDFGTMEDMKRLIGALHAAKIKIVMDLVVNHTSDEHPWFQASRRGEEPYKNFYHWQPKKRNWTSFFGGEAWTYDDVRKEYYLHLFSKKQPDLNWDHPQVMVEVQNIMRFWLDLGIDGFRCDVINLIGKETGDPNGRFSPILCGIEHYLNHPKTHRYLQTIRDEVISKYDCFTVGETGFVNPDTAMQYVDEDIRELDMLFQFEHMGVDNYYVKWFMRKFKPIRLKKNLSEWQHAMHQHGWNALYLENHDQPRSISRFGDPKYHEQSAKMLATMMFFQQGTPFVYQGQELGMPNASFEHLEEYRDIETKNIYKTGKKLGFSHRRMMKKIRMMSRDNARTPMPWDNTVYAGFSKAEPWISFTPGWETRNVQNESADKKSVLAFYRKLIQLRKHSKTIHYGDYQDIDFGNPTFYAYRRMLDQDEWIIVCNFSNKPHPLPNYANWSDFNLVLSNEENQEMMSPYGARVYQKK
ncbi:MAG: alpha-glucosidase [Candidatus Izemoplasmatales bacterium]|nr:alpha-glucosidase [Candidatus Izemoplasmatales bacterium]